MGGGVSGLSIEGRVTVAVDSTLLWGQGEDAKIRPQTCSLSIE